MATWDDVHRIATAMPDVTERVREGVVDWRVKDKLFVWERPLRGTDLKALGSEAPDGPILAARVPDLGAKEALLASDHSVYFTTPHFNGYPAILVRLEHIEVGELEELIVEAWHARGTAPMTLTKWIREVADEPLLLKGDLLAQAEENTWSLGTAKGETPVAADVVAAFEETARRLGERVTAMERTATFYVWYDVQAGHLKCSTSSAKKDALPFGAKVDPDATLVAVVGDYLAGVRPGTDEDFVLPVWTAEVGL